MFNKNKKITFQASLEKSELLTNYPSPGYKHIPDWYRKQKLFSNDENLYLKAFKKSRFSKTYKMCTPLIDSLTSGYMVTLPADIIVTNTSSTGYVPNLRWDVSWDIADAQPVDVLGNYPVPDGFFSLAFRWHPEWIVNTPPGYSLWVTHPSHRHDLPFFTLNAFVDTDKHPNGLMFPFFVKNGFEGIIEKDTPIVQIIPIKRNSWVTKIKKFNSNSVLIGFDNVNLKFSKFYKYNYWSKKKYE